MSRVSRGGQGICVFRFPKDHNSTNKMPMTCLVLNCHSRRGRDDVCFYAVPKALNYASAVHLNSLSAKRRQEWIKALNRGDLTESKLKNSKVCSKHFIQGKPAGLMDINNPDWIPSQRMGSRARRPHGKKRTNPLDIRNFDWILKDSQKFDIKGLPESNKLFLEKTEILENGKKQEILEEIDNILIVEQTDDESLEEEEDKDEWEEDKDVEEEDGIATQTDLTIRNLNEVTEALYISKSTIDNLLSQINRSQVLSYESLQNDNEKCLYYTGLQFAFLKYMFEKIKDCIPVPSEKSLDPFQQFLLTLIKLRLNLQFKDLSYRFGVSETECSAYFDAVISAMYQQFKTVMLTHDLESKCKNVPQCFQQLFGDKNIIIIDCSQVALDKQLSSQKNQVLSKAKYRKSNYIKFLMGITCQGSIVYMSKVWEAEKSDQEIVKLSGFLNEIDSDDIILSQFLTATVKPKMFNPAFMKINDELVPLEVESTNKLTHTVRVHMQRIISSIKCKFDILQGPIPITMLTNNDNVKIIDKVLVVICNLINYSQLAHFS